MNEPATMMTNDLDRLAERIEKAAAVLQALRTERDQLAARLQEVEQRLQGHDPFELLGELQALRREQRDWQAERRDVALRVEALIKKLERLEG
jgi:chromosome segregation ATPase